MNLVSNIKALRLRLLIAFYRVLPLKKNKIILWANSFKHYGCSPKYITEYIVRQFPERFDIVWVFEDGVEITSDLPSTVRTVRYFSLAYLKELHTAAFIICNMRTGNAYMWKKRRRQKYIQTWHSSLRLKKIEGDAATNLPQSYIDNARKDSVRTDLILSGCDFSTEIFRNSFWYDGEILKSGTPRCDIFFDNNSMIRQKVCSNLGIDPTKKILLYAPTFRNDKQASLNDLDFGAIEQALSRRFGKEWCIIFRFHPNITTSYDLGPSGIDATRYPDMQELLVTADVLVTDYSSCMFDMAVARKPCFLYCPDLGNYVKNERGLYFNISELPFPLAQTNDELQHNIENFDTGIYNANVDDFLSRVGSYEDGHAVERVVNYICSNL